MLAEKAGVEVPETGDKDGRRQSSRKALQELHVRAAGTFNWLLNNSPDAAHARDYLTARGISPETAETYRLGWAPADGEWLYRFLLSKKYSPEFLAESGLFSRKSPRWSYFVDRLMFPVMPDDERVVAFSGRALSERGPKYINSPETVLYRKSRELYGYGQARKGIRTEKQAVVCEGNVDVLACMQAGMVNVVAPLGTAFTAEQAQILKRQAETAVLLFDGDAAGQTATRKAAILCEQAGLTVKAVPMPPGRDPADILEADGPESLKKLLQRPINIFDYLLDFVISAQTGVSGEAQEEALKELTPYLESVGSEVRREAYLNRLADAIKANPATVIRDFRKPKSTKTARRFETEPRDGRVVGSDVFSGDEIFLMTAVTVRTEYFATLRERLAPERLRDRRALAVYRLLDELSVNGRVPRTEEVVSQLEDEALKQFILRKAASQVYDDRAGETISDIIVRLSIQGLEEEKGEIVRIMSRDLRTDPDITEARIRRLQEIDREILNIRQGGNGRDQV